MTNKPNDVRVSRELAELCYRALNGGDKQLSGTEHAVAFRELRRALAQPADQQCEPVAWLVTLIDDGSTYCITEDKLRADRLIADSDYVITPLYRHAQPATAKVDENKLNGGSHDRRS